MLLISHACSVKLCLHKHCLEYTKKIIKKRAFAEKACQPHSTLRKCGTTTVWKLTDAIIRLLVLLSVYTALLLSALAGQKNHQPVMQDGNACTTFLTELFQSSIPQVLGRAGENRSEQDSGSTFLCFQTDHACSVIWIFECLMHGFIYSKPRLKDYIIYTTMLDQQNTERFVSVVGLVLSKSRTYNRQM